MKCITKIVHVAVLALTLSAPALAADDGGVDKPDIPKAIKGTQCVRPTDDMRRNHMKYLLHHRDETMHEGIRTKQFSLKNCISCHEPPEGSPAVRQEKGHFCQNCHEYAAVHIDCFECHAKHPENDKSAGFSPALKPGVDPTTDTAAAHRGEMFERLAGVSSSGANTNATGNIHE